MILCEEVVETNGRWDATNFGMSQAVVAGLPAQISLCLACRLSLSPGEDPTAARVTLEILDPSGQYAFHSSTAVEVGKWSSLQEPDDDVETYPVVPVTFRASTAGLYQVQMAVDGEVQAVEPLRVVAANRDA